MYQLLYKKSYEVLTDEIKVYSPDLHTMSKSLGLYVKQKLPVGIIDHIIQKHGVIEVHSIYPTHFDEVANKLLFTNLKQIEFKPNRSKKKFNLIRPTFYIANKNDINTLIVCVPPGSDYRDHYVSLIKYYIFIKTQNEANILKTYDYPIAEENLSKWTELDHRLIHKDDIVLIGYVEQFERYISKKKSIKFISKEENSYYCAIRYKLSNDQIVNLLGVKYSFWGNLGGIIAKQIASLEAKEVIYIGKLGALTRSSDIYSKIFSPSKFITIRNTDIFSTETKNNLLDMFPELNSGVHISVPTVLEQGYVERKYGEMQYAHSIDNELSQIAFSIGEFNEKYQKNVLFSSLHIATDYLRMEDEHDLTIPFDLSNNRTNKAKINKRRVLNKLNRYLYKYLEINH